MHRLSVDWTACRGHGGCIELLPELLDVDPWGFPLTRDGSREAAVPAGLEPHARLAVEACPRLALRLLPAQQPDRSGTRA